jgi:hypothetical protein
MEHQKIIRFGCKNPEDRMGLGALGGFQVEKKNIDG